MPTSDLKVPAISSISYELVQIDSVSGKRPEPHSVFRGSEAEMRQYVSDHGLRWHGSGKREHACGFFTHPDGIIYQFMKWIKFTR